MTTVALLDVARYSLDDPDALVAASFSCPLCLRECCRVALDDGEVLPFAQCTCVSCGQRFRVDLDAHQLLRLALDPPSSLYLRWGEQARGLRGLWTTDIDLDA